MRVVAHLRQKPSETDAVGRRQRRSGLQRRIVQCGFHHALAVVETSLHTQCADVIAKAFKLMCLPRRHAAIGVKDHDFHRRLLVKCGADSGAGIAGGRDEDRQRLIVVMTQAAQTRGKKTRAYIFECSGRAVEKFEHGCFGMVLQGTQRCSECQCFGTDRGKLAGEFISHKKWREQRCCRVRQRSVWIKTVGMQRGQMIGHVETAVRRQSCRNGIA
jgi:hypothetical protein